MSSRRLHALALAGVLLAGTAGCAQDAPVAQIEHIDTGLRVTFPVGVDEASLPQEAPAGGRVAKQGDGAVLVLDAESRMRIAYLPPEPPDLVRLSGSGRTVTARLGADAGPRDDDGERTEAVTVTIAEADSLISEATWVSRDNDGLNSLQVTPSDAGRRWSSPTAMDAGWRQVLDAAPDADTPGMKEQYMCHAQFAQRKDAWYLEPWRPAGSYLETVAARCNRGPQSDPEL